MAKHEKFSERMGFVVGAGLIRKRKFKWPCYKRKAHGPHMVKSTRNVASDWYDCPGVKAHPATQIGGGYAQEDIPA